MKIIYKTGNIVDASEPVIAHGCNAQGVMGSGVAKAIRETFPQAYESYLTAYRDHGLHVGSVIWAVSGTHFIANCISQQYYGRDGRKYVSYDGLTRCFQQIDNLVPVLQDENISVAMPKIGAGLAGGDWEIIESIIETNLKQVQPVVYTLE